jgi:hypothetical protein
VIAHEEADVCAASREGEQSLDHTARIGAAIYKIPEEDVAGFDAVAAAPVVGSDVVEQGVQKIQPTVNVPDCIDPQPGRHPMRGRRATDKIEQSFDWHKLFRTNPGRGAR